MTRLFLPGPTDVAPETLAAQTRPMVGHRSQACAEMLARLQPTLRQVFSTHHRVFITASTGSGLQEAAVRNCVAHRLLVCVGGAFAQRWHDIARANGVPADSLEAEWGQPHTPEAVEQALVRRRYDALAIVHNETSTGVENPLAEIAPRARRIHADLVLLVDAVSSAGGVALETDAWGLDVVLTSSQKCFALPPGLGMVAVSDRALARARTVPHRGWYFDFLLYEEALAQHTTPATPALSLLYALEVQLRRMVAEGLPARFARHAEMARRVQDWADERFANFAAAGFRSKTVTTITNTHNIDVHALNASLASHGMVLANGYGPLKNRTFRIGHMGETQPEDIDRLLGQIEAFLADTHRGAQA
jgi:predicted phosphoserine aminotransferase